MPLELGGTYTFFLDPMLRTADGDPLEPAITLAALRERVAAKLLRISRKSLQVKMRDLGLRETKDA